LWLLLLVLYLRLLLGPPKAMALKSNLGSTSRARYQITVHVAVYRDFDWLIDRELSLVGGAWCLLCVAIRAGGLTALDRLLSLENLLACVVR
jgi:hypothetical protein